MKLLKKCFVLILMLSLSVSAQEIINLYPRTIPNSKVAGAKETVEKVSCKIVYYVVYEI